jgi:hypothetical protein
VPTKNLATKETLLALLHSVLAVLPNEGASAWQPEVQALPLAPGGSRRQDPFTGCPFNWAPAAQPASERARWAFSPQLLDPERPLRILGIVADEGSDMFALAQYLATGPPRLRVVFFRDPLHKLSNTFTAAVRMVPEILRIVVLMLVVHKYRRAPYGNARLRRRCPARSQCDCCFRTF